MKMIMVILFATSILQAQVHVNGYYRQDGTFVQPHFRTYPDGNLYNNYSSNRIAENAFPTTIEPINISPSNTANLTAERDLISAQIAYLRQLNESKAAENQFYFNLIKEGLEQQEQQKEEKYEIPVSIPSVFKKEN